MKKNTHVENKIDAILGDLVPGERNVGGLASGFVARDVANRDLLAAVGGVIAGDGYGGTERTCQGISDICDPAP